LSFIAPFLLSIRSIIQEFYQKVNQKIGDFKKSL